MADPTAVGVIPTLEEILAEPKETQPGNNPDGPNYHDLKDDDDATSILQ